MSISKRSYAMKVLVLLVVFVVFASAADDKKTLTPGIFGRQVLEENTILKEQEKSDDLDPLGWQAQAKVSGNPLAQYAEKRAIVYASKKSGDNPFRRALMFDRIPPFLIAVMVFGMLAFCTGVVFIIIAFSVVTKRRKLSEKTVIEELKSSDGPPKSLIGGCMLLALSIILFGLGFGLACRVPAVITEPQLI